MGAEARLLKLEEKLTTLGFDQTLRAVDLMKKEMSAARGFKRHDGSDYYYHLIDVTLILLNSGIKEQPVLTGSLNHDFPEDVDGVTVETLRHLWGNEVADMVKPLTKQKGVNYKDLQNLKDYYVPILQNCQSSLIKAGDILHNMSTLEHASKDKKIRKIEEAKEVYIPFLREARNKFPRYANFFWLIKNTLVPLVKEMEAGYKRECELQEIISQLKTSHKGVM